MAPDPHRGVIIPAFNAGRLLAETVRDVLAVWQPVVVVDDGSTDESIAALHELRSTTQGLHLLTHPANAGKGAAVLTGLDFAAARGWTHAAVFDADGQHEPADVPRFMTASQAHPEAMILGRPVFGPEAPRVRVLGRRLGNWLARLETWSDAIHDSLFGLRIYPVGPARDLLHRIRGGRRFDFETQMAVRLYWCGVPSLNLPARVRYRSAGEGGVSHFRYGRDNFLLARTHAALLLRSLLLAPQLIQLRRRRPAAVATL
jgi:glycosyltransferase involved in cell wall biosynthesis